MSEELNDEITSINSIYESNTLKELSERTIYGLTFPSQPKITLRLEFTADYPDAPPSIIGTESVGDDVVKGEGSDLVELARNALSEIYVPGAPCVFDLIEEVGSQLQQLGLDQGTKDEEQQGTQADGQHESLATYDKSSSDRKQPLDIQGDEPPWTLSEVVSEKKSVFVARAAPVTSVDQAKQFLANLLASDKKVAKATHNITAWRIQGENGVQYQDCDDDGESAAGGRVLHLMELMNVWNAMVVVTRWYGGVQLGPDRFRIINQTARDALVSAGFVQDSGSKKKGKK